MDRPRVGELSPPDRMLMGPGPSDVHPRVLRAMSTPLVGHLDPAFVEIMDDVQDLLRYAFRTDNQWTIPVSGTGSAAMEAAVANLTEPGDTVLVPGNGYFGERMAAMVRRADGEAVFVDAPWGEPLDPAAVEEAFDRHQPDILGFVHAETSTGALQPNVPELTSIAHEHDALVIADTVTSLGGVELRVDEWGIDVAYSADQKCLSCPPGASPLTLNDRAMDKVLSRETPVRSWYLDLSLLQEYWGDERAYHHTAPITNVYALREALRLVAEEGIENRWARHRRVAGALKAGVEAMGLELNPEEDWWLPSLNAVRLPAGVDDGTVIEALVEEYGIEIAGGLGDLSGDILRIGCMGHSARAENVLALTNALGNTLEALDADVDADAGANAARRALRR
ncbi:alanine--glyoxylate aminotransferase [Halorientalis sp. IM1011]|uniref:pyridoxal-phosphate-dependent aminotransferase family protein n=1 Tax=Halorientalis sp. IM1011 TaxID=1932360 RepID=UPI00097CD2BD|nr:alanine--glyoxylate aminotransferase family protein [Halorientalis sp. IM1011]AQL41534.1 alanine--glyoxylate aminotransferase [Halorientalis sp. IM1011]